MHVCFCAFCELVCARTSCTRSYAYSYVPQSDECEGTLVCRLNCDSARHQRFLPSISSPEVSSENTSRSSGTRLISSVIKINEVLIAAVIYANDCGTQDEDFLSLLQSEGRSGIWCVRKMTSMQLSASDVAVVIVFCDGGDAGGGVRRKSPVHGVCCIAFWTPQPLVSLWI